MSAKSGTVGAIYKQSSTTATFTSEAATLQADLRTVIINNLLKAGFVRNPTLFTVYKNGSAVTIPYEIHFDRVIFNEAVSAGTWTISGTYAELETVGGAYEWGVDLKHSAQDETSFGDTWEKKLKGLLGWTASAKRHWIDDDYITIASAGLPIILRLFTDIDTHDSYVGYGQIDGIKQGDKVDGVTDGEISFSGSGRFIWSTVAPVDIP